MQGPRRIGERQWVAVPARRLRGKLIYSEFNHDCREGL